MIKRFNYSLSAGLSEMEESDRGEYIKYIDYENIINGIKSKIESAIVTDNTKTLNAALERNAELEAKLSEIEKQEPVGYAVEVYYQSMIDPGNCGEGLEIYSVEDFDKTDRSKDDENVFPVYALPVPQQQDNRINSNHNEILKDALKKIIQMNLQYAHDRYGNANEAENMGCVKVAREALGKIPPITK